MTKIGTLDGFFGVTKPRVQYNATAVLYSPAGRAVGRLSGGPPYVTVQDVLAARYESVVRCNPSENGTQTRAPCPGGAACLFDLLADPCETVNVAREHVSVTAQLYDMLKYYRRLLVPQSNQPFDPNANPVRYNDTWSSWAY